jgi:hypothetical protein
MRIDAKSGNEEAKKESLIVKGRCEIFKCINGHWTRIRVKDNLIVDTGLEYIADRMKDNSIPLISHTGVGTDATPVTPADTTLGAEIARKIFDDLDAIDNQVICESIFGTGEAVGTWEEVAIFNDATAGTMINRINITYTKSSADAVKVRFTLTFSRP